MPKARDMSGFESFHQGIEMEAEDKEDEDIEENECRPLIQQCSSYVDQEEVNAGEENQNETEEESRVETRWVLGSSSGEQGGVIASNGEDDKEGQGENFQQAFVRNLREVVTRRTGTRARKPKKGYDEVKTTSASENRRMPGEREMHMGYNKRYASINVRTLAMKGDKNRKEACGQTAAAVGWVMEFEERGLGIVGLQECRIPNGVDGCEGSY